MKVLFPIGTLFPSEQGGPSNTIYWMAKALVNHHIEVVCIATDLGLPPESVEIDEWLTTNYGKIRYTSDVLHSMPFKLLYHSYKELPSCDVLHLTSIFYPPSWILACIALFYKKKIVWSVRGNFEKQAIQISRWKKKPLVHFIRRVFHSKAVFHTTSSKETENTRKILGENTLIIELPNFLELPERIDYQENNSHFLYIGRIHPIKALDNLIKALNTNEFKQSNYTFKIVGDGDLDYMKALKNTIEKYGLDNKVEFVKHTIGKAKQQLYANARFTFLISHSENFGNVVIESLAQGTPVVASKGTPWQVLEQKNIGYWVENDSVSLSKTIELIMKINAEEYNLMREKSYEFVTQNFDISHNIDKWIEVYNK